MGKKEKKYIPKPSKLISDRAAMDLVGEFHKREIDGEVYLVCHNVMYKEPLTSSDKVAIDLPLQPLFVCPTLRLFSPVGTEDKKLSKCDTSPLYDDRYDHHVLPLFWCNNEKADPDGECCACKLSTFSTKYYFCVECDKRFHKECVESPLDIFHPRHSKLSFDFKHSLQLFSSGNLYKRCHVCRRVAKNLVYHCVLCEIYMHVLCAYVPIPFFFYREKLHQHTLTFFPRQGLTCNVCGLVFKNGLTYVCPECDFVSHINCKRRPQTIKINRHDHLVSFVSSLPLRQWICGVCRQDVDRDYGSYTCNVCSGYVVHTKCGTRRDIWDGIEREGVPEEEGENVEPFERIDDGVILHFSHGHHLRLEDSKVSDGNKFCQACGLPIYKDSFYTCVECNFILHEICANAPLKKVSPLHPHMLQLEVARSVVDVCSRCSRNCNGFVYRCPKMDCYKKNYILDVSCALVSEPFTYQGHPHLLFLALHPYDDEPMCHICKLTERRVLNCIESDCDFNICFKCATLPYMAMFKHDEHYLTLSRGDEASHLDWCELCEGKLAIGGKEGFYKCNDCCTTLHINCLLGPDPFLVSGNSIGSKENIWHMRRNDSLSRKICNRCRSRCPYPVFSACEKEYFACSLQCYS